ncbi:MAG: neuraminidase-like domain-containing protein, partial [Chitinophagaceae bacterium]
EDALLDVKTKTEKVKKATEDVKRAAEAVNTATPANMAAAQALLSSAQTSLAAALALLQTAENQKIATLPGYNIATGRDLLKAFLDAIAEFQVADGKKIILGQTIATSFKADAALVEVILKYARLKQPPTLTRRAPLLSALLQKDNLIDTTNSLPVLPAITETVFANEYAAIRLLSKVLPMINAFKLNNNDIAWVFEHGQRLGWFEWDSIPYAIGQAIGDYNKYISLAAMIDLSKQYTPVADPADAGNPVSFLNIMLLALRGNDRDLFMSRVALLTGYEKDDLLAIDAYLFSSPSDLFDYKNIATWKQLIACAEYLRKLDADVEQVKKYIKPVLNTGDVSALRVALKSRYDEETWLSTLKEIMNAIRPQKRNALVAYLLAVNPDMKDENDLFDYFLVDVEMESCMPSSRIVQAHGTIQLFVQRCLMGLEPAAAADIDNDKSWNQWKWMKNYRVWEANRKVFLYPENWIEPELRDDKSFLFAELENEIQQNELTGFTAEEALIKYLEKLDDIAFLEVMATWYQTDTRIMHVFARTKGGDPAIYYYRRFEQERYWTPWEKVEVDITGDQLLAYIRNNRLSLAWPVFTEVPEPDQKSTIPDTTPGNVVDNEKPKRKLKVQLAISEFANKKWQPKKISKDAILTPGYFTAQELPRDQYNMLYFEFGQQIWIYHNEAARTGNDEIPRIDGIFNIAGCKGYPELSAGTNPFIADFLPDFRDTQLSSQRYNERTLSTDALSVKNGYSFYEFITLLKTTPGKFRISYPHQFTAIDGVLLSFQYLVYMAFHTNESPWSFKIPLGTMLPYFMEDSEHAYVVMPGFYAQGEDWSLNTSVKRTGSDVMRLIEDVQALHNKFMGEYKQDTRRLVEDPDFQRINKEISAYDLLAYGEQFKNLYHPLVCALRTTMNRSGIPALMKRETQMQQTKFDFRTYYNPNQQAVPQTLVTKENGNKALSYPVEDVDFESDGSYSCYNWELFFHVPFLLATRLTKNQRFEEAMAWFHYIFNPTGALPGTTPQKYWVTKPFYLNQDVDYVSQRIDTLLNKIANPSTLEIKELEFAISEWRSKPFNPHVIARFRPVAYQKVVIIRYIDNLIEWGDHLFRQDTMESIAQATQMYILADKLLGPKPRTIPKAVKAPYETYNQVERKLDHFGNALIGLENILPDLSGLPEHGAELPPPPVTLSMLYFCIPQNDKMLEYWERIEGRLFNIRHCRNIDGVERSLALFAPPIDPGMLVRAAASGLDISSVLAGINAPAPYYRFNMLSQKATELAQEVRGLGSSLLQALEKKDAEAMSLLRSELEIKVLNAVKDMKLLQIKESKEQIEVLKRTKKVTEERFKYYSTIKKISSNEQLSLDKLQASHEFQTAAQGVKLAVTLLALIPDLDVGASGVAASPVAKVKFGGLNLSKATNAASDILSFLGMRASNESARASIVGGHERRFDDWKLQERLANLELNSIEKQITAADIRREIAETDLKNHELQIDNAKKSDEFMRTKFTNKELYEWMIGQISAVYFSAYKLAHDVAKKAERSYRFELGNDDTFIAYGYWDSMKKGLQSADRLLHDIKRMEVSYLDKNKREYELTKHVSLSMLDPLALIQLRATGKCDFDIPEVLYDIDHAGHYFRRIKSVSISIPCIAGPYTSVSAKLSLVNNRYRKNINTADGYAEDPGNDERFTYNVGSIQSIATSNAQNDGGVFELNFRDERYLPFEGAGAISSWRLELPSEIRQFDYDTIPDVIVHVKYTAREGGSGLQGAANSSLADRMDKIKQQLGKEGLHVAINVKHDLPNEWHLLTQNGNVSLKIDKSRLPYMVQSLNTKIEDVTFIGKETKQGTLSIKVNGGN